MHLTMNIADTTIGIEFLGLAEKAVPLCQQFFRDFLCSEQTKDAKVKLSVLRGVYNDSPIGESIRFPAFEQRLPTRDAVALLKKSPKYEEDFPVNETTLSSSCLDGLLLFDPDTAAGRLYLLNQGPECFRPLYRLFWIYFAQVLGERESCFVHSAALVKDKRGYLFLGDSGAGKSSLARVCQGALVLSDDSPILCKRNGNYLVFPSPYHQIDPFNGLNKEVVGLCARVESLYFLTKDNQLYLDRISREKAISMILNRSILFFPYLSSRAKSTLFDLVIDLCDNLPLYDLHFRLDRDVWGFISAQHPKSHFRMGSS